MSVPGIWAKVAAFSLLCEMSFYFAGLNRTVWRYASISDLIAIIIAATLAVAVFTVGNLLVGGAGAVSGVAAFLTWVFLIFGLGGARLFFRLLKDYGPVDLFRRGKVKRVILYPHSDTTDAYIRAAKRQSDVKVSVAGIVDSRAHLRGSQLHGCTVLGTARDIGSIVARSRVRGTGITELIVSDPKTSGEEMTALLEACNEAGIAIFRWPDILDPLLTDSDRLLSTKPVQLEHLLERPEVTFDPASVMHLINGKSVLVTGAGGSIGAELCHQIASFGPRHLILLDFSAFNLVSIESEIRDKYPSCAIEPVLADVRDRNRMESIFRKSRPDVVFHAAAIKHVPLVETNPVEGIKTNLLGTLAVARASVAHGTKVFVLVSTDKAVNPTSVMGAAKRAAERFCQSIDLTEPACRFQIVRFGNVLGSSGSVVPRFRQQVARGGPLTITDPEVSRYFMTISEAVRLMLEAASEGLRLGVHRGRVLVLDMGKPIRIADLASRLVQLAGYKAGVDIKMEYTGLRAGEKLHEELLGEEERVVEEIPRKFFVASSPVMEKVLFDRSLSEIEKACGDGDAEKSIKLLRHIVPAFRSAGDDTAKEAGDRATAGTGEGA